MMRKPLYSPWKATALTDIYRWDEEAIFHSGDTRLSGCVASSMDRTGYGTGSRPGQRVVS